MSPSFELHRTQVVLTSRVTLDNLCSSNYGGINGQVKTCNKQGQVVWSTHSSFEHVVVDVVSATLRAGEGEPLAVTVTLLVCQLCRRPQQAVSLLLPLLPLLRPELTGVQPCNRHRRGQLSPQDFAHITDLNFASVHFLSLR